MGAKPVVVYSSIEIREVKRRDETETGVCCEKYFIQ